MGAAEGAGSSGAHLERSFHVAGCAFGASPLKVMAPSQPWVYSPSFANGAPMETIHPPPEMQLEIPVRVSRRLSATLVKFVGISCGRAALDSVEMPERLAYVPHPRTSRLVKTAQLSAW
jgi:hypothetical protein